MKALIIEAPGCARIIETEKPKAGLKDVVVRVAYSGICGTDLAIYSGETDLVGDGAVKYPVRIGHEWSGIVEEVGGEVTGFKPGDRVIADNGVTCGRCKHCLDGDYMLCENVMSVGTINCWDGSFAEYMLMPERHLYKLPDEISLEEAALIEPATIALAGIRHSNAAKGDTLLIIGTGAIGISVIPMAKAMGIGKVIISGRKPYKLEVAKTMGADVAVNVTKEDLKETVMRETNGKGADIIVETSGNINTPNQCVEMIKTGGFIALVGFYEMRLDGFHIDAFVMKAALMRGITGELGLPRQVIDLMVREKISLKPLITHRFRFEEVVRVFETAGRLNDTKIKMMVEMSRK